MVQPKNGNGTVRLILTVIGSLITIGSLLWAITGQRLEARVTPICDRVDRIETMNDRMNQHLTEIHSQLAEISAMMREQEKQREREHSR